MDAATKPKHHYYFDYMRVFAMLCVVFMHLASGPLRVDTQYLGKNWHLINLATSLSFTAVPLFFMMSGYLLMSSSHTPDVGYLLKKRVPRLVVPLLFWSAVAAFEMSVLYHTGPMAALKQLASVGSTPVMIHFWFMYTLIAMYLVSPLIYGGVHSLDGKGRRYLLWLMVITMVLLTAQRILPETVTPYLPYRIPSEAAFFGGHIIAFLLGWFLGSMERRVPNWLLVLVALADWGCITFMTWRRTVASGFYNDVFQSQDKGFELVLAACIFLFCKQNLDRPLGALNRLTTPVAALAFPVYLTHNLLISILIHIWLPTVSAPQVLFSTFFIALCCCLIVKTLATIKPLCFLVTGIPYAEACRSCNWVCTFRKHS